MKTLIILLLIPAAAHATGYSGLNNELAWMYGIIIGFLLIPVLIRHLVKYFRLKNKIEHTHHE